MIAENACVFAANSLLFVPGSRPDRFAKARGAGAGLTAIDLEDAVAATDKGEASAQAFAQFESAETSGWGLRINAVDNSQEAMRVFGGYSYSKEYDIERYYRDSMLMCIGEGTNEMQRMIIAKQHLKENKI